MGRESRVKHVCVALPFQKEDLLDATNSKCSVCLEAGLIPTWLSPHGDESGLSTWCPRNQAL